MLLEGFGNVSQHPKEWVGFTGHFRSDNQWYGSMRVVIRKGQLMIDGEQPLVPVESSTFRPAGDSDVDRLIFDVPINGQATRLNYSGIEFFRTFTH